ncbi:MAG: CRISPR-associated endonuclease Cas2 [Ignavibacteriales bacterium CG18_big_fil_WC_8_21_14_2_50_31_20]|nr:MAG: CRISPR-associated endonuclease Cas2 [Ignavibacteriales bacterium CG18_big_fil_WC_8_21_14_2_50_31_20]
MYYIVTYDIKSPKRLPKALKTCRKFLFWVQKSVFEGELTKTQFNDLKNQLTKVIDKKVDMVLFYEIRNTDVVNKNILGNEANPISKFI